MLSRHACRATMLRLAVISVLTLLIVALFVYSGEERDAERHQHKALERVENRQPTVETNLRASADMVDGDKPKPLVPSNVTCTDVLHWIPPSATNSTLLVVQVVNESYLKIQENFMAWVAKSSAYMKDSMYLLCLDEASIAFMSTLGVRCVEVDGVIASSGDKKSVWLIRMKVLECLLDDERDVLMSDNDAFWLKDPIPELANIEGNLLAQRAPWPAKTGDPKFGVTMCMGFALFRAGGKGMTQFQKEVDRLLHETGDDQVSVNRAASSFKPQFDYNMKTSDMRYQKSIKVGKSILKALPGNFRVSYLPHNKFTRDCQKTPVTDDTVVAHCHTWGTPEMRIANMKKTGVWMLKH